MLGVRDEGEVEALRVGGREPCVPVLVPLHRRPHAVAIAQVDVVAHPDLVAVVDDGGAGEREEQRVHQLDPAPVVAQERGQPPADPQVHPRLRVASVDPVHVVALFVGDHLERELVVVAEERRPLTALRDRGRLVQDVDQREPVLHPVRHEHPRHQREVERHVAAVSLAEVRDGILRPLVGLREQHPILERCVDVTPQIREELQGLREVLAVRSLPLEQVGHGVQPQSIHAEPEPEVDDVEHRRADPRLVEVEDQVDGSRTDASSTGRRPGPTPSSTTRSRRRSRARRGIPRACRPRRRSCAARSSAWPSGPAGTTDARPRCGSSRPR